MPPRGQVLIIVALALVVLLGSAGIAVDLGRQMAERRHVQTAADAAALAACRDLIDGQTDATAAQSARDVALVNLEGSPAGASAEVAASPVYWDGHAGDPAWLKSGVIVSGTSVRVAVWSTLQTALARVVGIPTLEIGAKARCGLQGSPAIPVVARRYEKPPGPANGFTDHLATAATSTVGEVDPVNTRGYNGRTPAGEGASAGPIFPLYGNESKANNDSSFRGFIALDVRNFEAENSRIYYNSVTSGTNVNTLKDMQGAYLVKGYPGPGFPPVSTPPTGDTQVAVISGQSNSFVVGQFESQYVVGDRLLLGIYDGTVMEIPDFSISLGAALQIPSTTTTPYDNPNSFTVSRNPAFTSTVTLHLHGDAAAPDPAHRIIPDSPVTPPAAGTMDEPTWSTNVFVPDKSGTRIYMNDISTNDVPPGIYTVWVEGHSGNPYFRTRRNPYAVHVNGTGSGADGPALRDFSFTTAVADGSDSNAAVGGTITWNVAVFDKPSTPKNPPSNTRWNSSNTVALSYDATSFTDCQLSERSLGAATIGFSPSAVTPTSAGAASTLTVNTAGLARGCYQFVMRTTGENGDGQPVTHLQTVRFTVDTTSSSGQYVDIIGFAVFEVTSITANDIYVKAVSPISADPGDSALRRAQRARLLPWNP